MTLYCQPSKRTMPYIRGPEPVHPNMFELNLIFPLICSYILVGSNVIPCVRYVG